MGKIDNLYVAFPILRKIGPTVVFFLIITTFFINHPHKILGNKPLFKTRKIAKLCPEVDIYHPSSYDANKQILHEIINDPVFRNQSVLKLQGAVKIDTSSYDNLPMDVGSNLDVFEKFNILHTYLESQFPLFFSNLEIHKVNHFGLVSIWHGSDDSLKPLLLMAHQDVVPISNDSLPKWNHDPFSGYYDGEFLYGRGSGDCKNLLIGHFEIVELLISIGFKPKRTIIFSHGFDEEIGGFRNHNSQFLEDLYGKDSMYAIMDEGGVSLQNIQGATMAIVGTGEKGYLDVSISIQKKGGHSSVPPKHTAIGIIGDLIVQIEKDSFKTYFTDSNPTYFQYVCLAENALDIDKVFKENILNSQNDKKANKYVRDVINEDRFTSYAIKTTQALDIINGGVKVNALPEFVELIINSRIALEESVDIVFDKFLDDTKIIAEKYNLGLNVIRPYNNESITILPETEIGVLTLKPLIILEPSPITQVNDSKWSIFAGTLRHIYEELSYPEQFKNKKVIVTPGLGNGNTDTKFYWNLSDHIYRYRPGILSSIAGNAHGINEYINFDSHLQIIAFLFEYIHSVDEIDDLD